MTVKHGFRLVYETCKEDFVKNSANSSQITRHPTPKASRQSTSLSETTIKKQPKLDKMKHLAQFLENDENSRPPVNDVPKPHETKKNPLYRCVPHSTLDNTVETDLTVSIVRRTSTSVPNTIPMTKTTPSPPILNSNGEFLLVDFCLYLNDTA